VDESEVLTPADKEHHINKHPFLVPFVCGARNFGEALRRIAEGAAMIRIKGDAGKYNMRFLLILGTGNVVNAVEHCRAIFGEIRKL
jgi:pyridoxal 5'-phosphate synthase pdxS subunit